MNDSRDDELRLDNQRLREALSDALAAIRGPVRFTPRPTYAPQISVAAVDRWASALPSTTQERPNA